jgi:hypothetical protein
MRLALVRYFLVAGMAVTALSVHAASPCDGVNRGLTNEKRAALESKIAKRLAMSSVDVLQSFQLGGWRILYVDTHQADEVFLFYSGDPLTSPEVTSWGGAAQVGEEQQIKDWTLKNARGIPSKLAGCFAWHVTKGRDL